MSVLIGRKLDHSLFGLAELLFCYFFIQFLGCINDLHYTPSFEASEFFIFLNLKAIKFRSSLFKGLRVEGRALGRIFKGETLKLKLFKIKNEKSIDFFA